MVLHQCAHFYNDIATEMIPCQKPMLLADAVEFEKVRADHKWHKHEVILHAVNGWFCSSNAQMSI